MWALLALSLAARAEEPRPLIREVEVRTVPAPRVKDLPKNVTFQPGDHPRCTLRLNIDDRGQPATVEPLDCAYTLVPAVRGFARRYRFVPRVVNEHATWATYDVVVDVVPGTGIVAVDPPEPPPAEPAK